LQNNSYIAEVTKICARSDQKAAASRQEVALLRNELTKIKLFMVQKGNKLDLLLTYM
jgi:hypothetical protein